MPTPVYDVTTFVSPSGTSPTTDIGLVINEIMSDIRSTQSDQSHRPGAVIYIPPGHYDLLTRAVIDRSFIQIKGSGHGFLSEAVRDDENQNVTTWYEREPGGSHVRVKNTDGNHEAFLVQRTGDPTQIGRLNSVEFRDFCIDGVTGSRPYLPGTGKIGISVQSDSDSLRIEGMGLVYLSHALLLRGTDASYVINNFITECGAAVEYVGSALVPKIQDNFLICPWAGNSIYIENCQGFLITGNTMLWHGAVTLNNCQRGSVTSNRFNSEFQGQLVLDNSCGQILVAGNHFYREPLYSKDSPSGRDDLFGMLHIRGSSHTITGNHLGFDVPLSQAIPANAVPTFILVANGSDHILSNNHIVSNRPGKVVLDASVTAVKLLWTTVSGQLQSYAPASAYNEVMIP